MWILSLARFSMSFLKGEIIYTLIKAQALGVDCWGNISRCDHIDCGAIMDQPALKTAEWPQCCWKTNSRYKSIPS
jgi:hypothetical protein